jgi:glutamyl-tRNA reductase
MIEVEPYDKLEQLLNKMRLLVTATSAPYPIINNNQVNHTNFTRHWFDIAIPRDIEVSSDYNIKVYAVDDLKDQVDKNLEQRAIQAKEAYLIIGQMTKEFYQWLGSLGVEPMLKNIYLNANNIIENKIQTAIKKHYIKEEDKENISKLCQSVMVEFLHTPTKNLRQSSKQIDSDKLIYLVKRLYNMED